MSQAITVSTDKVTAIENTLVASLPKLRQLMPSQLLDKPDVFVRSVVMAMRQTPALGECTPQSIVLSVAQACALGLPPNTPLGLSYLVPFKGQCQLVPGYKGLIRLAIQSGEVKSIDTRVVYKDDEFKLAYGLEETLVHIPNLTVEPKDESIVGAYAIAKLANGEKKFEFMSRAQIDAIRARSQSAKAEKSPWHTDYAEMCRKTVSKRICKTLPLSEENQGHRNLGRAIQIQERDEIGADPLSAEFLETFGEPESKPVKGSLAEKAGQ